jgi:uncharacterized protein (TIGR02466 family)
MIQDNNHVQIFYSFLDDTTLDIDLKDLTDYCYFVKDNDTGNKLSNVGGWQSSNLDPIVPELRPLVSCILERAEKLISLYNLPNTFKIDPIWININKKHDYNMIHEHPRSLFAGVFYVKAPKDSGDLVFINPNPTVQHYINQSTLDEHNPFNSCAWGITPTENTLMMFPAWLPHHTLPNLSNEDRISIAFNITASN